MEFEELVHQARRMCCSLQCSNCPIRGELRNGSTCPLFGGNLVDMTREHIMQVEAAIKEWAQENPEPIYPSWKAWQDKTFPNASRSLLPCEFMDRKEFDCRLGCELCRNTTIPANVAKKLGIEPKYRQLESTVAETGQEE